MEEEPRDGLRQEMAGKQPEPGSRKCKYITGHHMSHVLWLGISGNLF